MTLHIHDPMGERIARRLHEESDLSHSRELRTASASRALGALALGAVALGALAIGAVAVGRLAIGRARIRRLEIDELVVRQLRVTEELEIPSKPGSES